MLAAFDVHYRGARAAAAAVLFEAWSDAAPARQHTLAIACAAEYEPGAFYKRELPCLLALLAQFDEPLEAAIVDGYVSLGAGPGLGERLWNAVGERFAVIGVAKTRFRDAPAVEVFRGASRQPLWVTAAGLSVEVAAARVRAMHGQARLPTLLRRVDQLARQAAEALGEE